MDGLIFLYISIFPFGKLLGRLPDLIILLLLILNIRKIKFSNFISICSFSLIFSLCLFQPREIFTGILYLIRFVSYIVLSQVVLERFGRTTNKRILIFNSLILVGIFIAIFGWIQYLIFPDLRGLKALGWDDHYFRLTSTFLDPVFTGILLVHSEILFFVKTLEKSKRTKYFVNLFFIFTIAFTYSRASYLALLFSFAFLFFKFRNKLVIFLSIVFMLVIFVLPKQSGGEGVNLARTQSITDRFVNYKDSLVLISKSTIFGIGFNNICVAKEKFLGEKNITSHACSGLDNSILFIVATTGIVGLIMFMGSILEITKQTTHDKYGVALRASFIAIFIHGMFSNTFFYNFVLGWVAILIGIIRSKVKD